MSKQNLTRIVGIWWGIVILSMVIIASAQDIALELDTPLAITIGENPAWLTYAGQAGEIIQLSTMTAITDTAPDTTLEILYPDGRRLDYVDDVVFPDGTVKSDAILQHLELPVDGIYRIRVDSFNGVSEGDVGVILSQPENPLSVLTADHLTIISGDVDGDLSHTLEVKAGDSISLIARDVSGTLDPILSVLDADGELVAFNDDHGSNDLSLNVFDAQIPAFNVVNDMTITVVVRDYLGQSGTVELIISS